MFAYEEDEYPTDNTITIKHGRAKSIKVLDLETNIETTFESYSAAERYYQVPNKCFRGSAAARRGEKEYIIKNRFKITVLE